jgi:hypothetical protein
MRYTHALQTLNVLSCQQNRHKRVDTSTLLTVEVSTNPKFKIPGAGNQNLTCGSCNSGKPDWRAIATDETQLGRS